MKKLSKLLALILAACMLLGMLTACGGNNADTPGNNNTNSNTNNGTNNNADAVKDTTVVVGTTAAYGSFNANGGTAQGDNYVTDMVYSRLFNVDNETSQYYSPVSDDWGWDDDYTLRITVKDGITFASGAKMDAHDILATMNYNIEFGNQRARQWSVIDFEKTHVSEDGKTLYIVYNQIYGAAISELLFPVCDDEFLAAHPDGDEIWWSAPDGSGPYVVKDSVIDSYVVYELRNDYWDASASYDCTQITVKYYSDSNSLWAEYINGEVDVVLGLNDTQVASLQADPSLGTLVLQSTNNTALMAMNEHNEYLADPAVREAISYAIPWFEVGQIAWGSLAIEATSHYAQTLPSYTDHGSVYEYNPEKAKQILADAGYEAGEIQLLYVAVNETTQVRVMEAVQGYLDAVGIVISAETYELGTALPEYYFKGVNDLAIVTANGANNSREPWQLLSPLTNGLFLDRSQSDPEYVAMAEGTNATTDHEARMELFRQMDDWFYENNWLFPYCEIMEAWCFNSRIAELEMTNNWYDCLGNIKLS